MFNPMFLFGRLSRKSDLPMIYLQHSTVLKQYVMLWYVISLRLSETQQIDKDGEQKGRDEMFGRKKRCIHKRE